MQRTIKELLLKHKRPELLFSVANCRDVIVNCEDATGFEMRPTISSQGGIPYEVTLKRPEIVDREVTMANSAFLSLLFTKGEDKVHIQ